MARLELFIHFDDPDMPIETSEQVIDDKWLKELYQGYLESFDVTFHLTKNSGEVDNGND